jgi:hypothetical protein
MDSYLEGLYRTQSLEDTMGDRELGEPLGLPASPPVPARPEPASDAAAGSRRLDAPPAETSRRWLRWKRWN